MGRGSPLDLLSNRSWMDGRVANKKLDSRRTFKLFTCLIPFLCSWLCSLRILAQQTFNIVNIVDQVVAVLYPVSTHWAWGGTLCCLMRMTIVLSSRSRLRCCICRTGLEKTSKRQFKDEWSVKHFTAMENYCSAIRGLYRYPWEKGGVMHYWKSIRDLRR